MPDPGGPLYGSWGREWFPKQSWKEGSAELLRNPFFLFPEEEALEEGWMADQRSREVFICSIIRVKEPMHENILLSVYG